MTDRDPDALLWLAIGFLEGVASRIESGDVLYVAKSCRKMAATLRSGIKPETEEPK